MPRSWQSYAFNALLRLNKHPITREEHVAKLKRRFARLDTRYANALPAEFILDTRQTPDEQSVFAVDWLKTNNSESERRVILYFHGGAFCLHAPNIYRRFLAQLCAATDALGVLPDYRLAPHHPYPAAPVDCFSTYQLLLQKGYAAQDIAIAGDSAGGNLVLTTLLQIKQHNLPMPACAVLLSAAADADFSGKSYFENADKDPMFHLATLLFFRDYYLQGQRPTDAISSPLTESFSGYPPLYVSASSTEMLRDTSITIAENAKREEIDVELDIWPGQCHVHQLMYFIPESKTAISNIVTFINRHWTI